MGDTLSARALEFDVSAEAIADAGDLSDPNVLAINQELTIPCRVFEAAPPQATSTPAA